MDDPTPPSDPPPQDPPLPVSPEVPRRRLRELDQKPALVRGARALRRMLPGDKKYGDRLSTAGDNPADVLAARVAAASAERPSALREVGLSALQVWQALSEAQGRGRGERELAILFTDLVGFSSWALEAGDTMALELLRQVGDVIEPPVEEHGGRIVKRLGDGLMAVFDDSREAVEAALDASEALDVVEVGGHAPRLRAGVHVGRPRKVGGDYLGVDVNIAARIAAAAAGGEVLVSDATCERIGDGGVTLRRKRFFRAKGAPRDLKVFSVERAD